MRKWAGLIALVGLAFGLGQVFAQSGIPDGAFVRDSSGNVWLIAGGERSSVPMYQATDDQIAAVPETGKWLVRSSSGSSTMSLGNKPSWLGGQSTTPTNANDAFPTVSIQVDDDLINPNQTISITVIGSDDKGLKWIEWEGTIIENDDNDNQRTGDATLDGRHRHDCDERKQCANVWTVAPTKSGRFTLRARATDTADQRSEWASIPFRVR